MFEKVHCTVQVLLVGRIILKKRKKILFLWLFVCDILFNSLAFLYVTVLFSSLAFLYVTVSSFVCDSSFCAVLAFETLNYAAVLIIYLSFVVFVYWPVHLILCMF